jgi:hypothetical protein
LEEQIISNEKAQEYFEKLNEISEKKTFHTKRNWGKEEMQLLYWTIKSYCKQKNN